MLELELKTKEEVTHVAEAKQEYKYVGSMKLIPGLKLWQLSISDMKITEVEITKTVAVGTDKKAHFKKKVQYNPKCLYTQALNHKNAEKKFLKMVKEIVGE